MKKLPLILVCLLAGCQTLLLIPVGIVEKIEGLKPRTTTQPWHFEGQHVVYEKPIANETPSK